MKVHLKDVCRFAVLSFAVIALNSSAAWAAVASIANIQGEVLMARQAAPENWETLTAETPINSGDMVKTRTGSCVLRYTDQADFALGSNTQITVTDRDATQDIDLAIGTLKAKVNKEKTLKPFQVVTPAAVAAIRGTEVDFGFNDQGEMTADLHKGQIQVVNDATSLNLDLAGKKTIKIKFDKEANTFFVKNDCSSDGPITFSVLGTEYSQNPCEEQVVDLSTAENQNDTPSTNQKTQEENPDEGREPVSPTTT